MRTSIKKIGNSRGIIIPKPLISQLNLGPEIDLRIEKDAIVVRRAPKRVRSGWAEAAKQSAARADDRAIWPAFGNRDDKKLKW